MSEDIDVGFSEEPADLEIFLSTQGYKHCEDSRSGAREQSFEPHDDSVWPTLFYCSPVAKAEKYEVPDWSQAPRKIVAEMNINFPFGDSESWEKARTLSERLVRKYNAIIYESQSGDFITREVLGP